MNNILLLFLLSFSIVGFSAQLPQQSLVPGGIAVIELGKLDNTSPQVFYQKRKVLVVENNDNWVALIGIPLSAKPGQHRILLKNEQSPDRTIAITIAAKEYPSQYITIKNKRMVNPNPEDLERIKKDRIPINKALNTWTEQSIIDADFSVPVDGRLSSPFGLRRFFNNQPRNPHSGLDIAAPKGTPIKAPANGVVINSGNYYFNGNTVFMDHGRGLLTGYFHMNKIQVEAGQHLKRGDVLGTVGETGRVTGPHLHWNVYLNRTKVDPALFIARHLSKKDTASQ